ncbi:MAG: hypothetical protein H6737_08575 [Alphaproteobacteria bacterium]|nr:hypothetical protein [Alphaproteobacteria bacterium]
MRDWTKTKAEETRSLCTPEAPNGETQMAGNAAAIEAMAPVEEDGGYLLAFDGGPSLTSIPELYDWSTPEADATEQDQHVSDYRDIELPDFRGNDDTGSIALTPDGLTIEMGDTRREKAPLFGAASQTSRVIGGVGADGSTKVGFRHQRTELDGDLGGSIGGMVDTNGVVTAGGDVKVLGGEVAAQGSVDFAADGSVQAVGANVSAGGQGAKVAAGANVRFEHVERDGNTVRWSSGASASLKGEYAGVGGGTHAEMGSSDAITFQSEAEARAFEAQLTDQARDAGTASIGSDAMLAMPAGTRIDRSQHASVGGVLSVVASVGNEIGGQRSVEMERVGASGVVVRTEMALDQELSASVDNGWVGASGGRGLVRAVHQEFELDLSDPVQRSAFDTFQETGEMPAGIQPRSGEDMRGAQRTSSFHAPGSNLDQEASVTHGTVTEDGKAYGAVRGESADRMYTGSRYDIPVIIGSGLGSLASLTGSSKLEKGAQGWTRYGEWGREQQLLAGGSGNGSESVQMTMQAPLEGTAEERDAQATIRQVQRIAFDDQQQNARKLHDEVTRNVDAEDVDVAKLPAHGRTDRAFELETLIDAEGTQNVREGMRSEDGLPFEFGAAKHLAPIRESLRGSGDTAGALAYALAELAAVGGADAAEGVREMAGEEHVDRYLKLEGDDTWIGREGHDRIERLLEHGGRTELSEALVSEGARLERLMDHRAYPEVPEVLRNEEVMRTENNLKRLRGEI